MKTKHFFLAGLALAVLGALPADQQAVAQVQPKRSADMAIAMADDDDLFAFRLEGDGG